MRFGDGDSNAERNQPPPPPIPNHKLLKFIGGGSYGKVWLAQNTMGAYRAVKIVSRNSFSDEKPFERELSGIRKFEPISRSHEGFVDVLEVGINREEGYFYYVMELGDDQETGQVIDPEKYHPKSLGQQISLHRKLSYRECLELGMALSQSLAELHKRGLVHRDVKPSNIIFVNGVPKLADIGLVAELGGAQSYVGTEGFIPPEGPGTPQADVYGLGKVLYEASTGKDRKDFPELPTLLEDFADRKSFFELNEVILHACKNEIGRRYQSAWEMYADLVALANGKSIKRLRLLERRLLSLKRLAALLVLVLAILGIVIYGVYREKKAVKEARQRQDIASGNNALDSGDLLRALPYFADAVAIDQKNSSMSPAHRLEFSIALSLCPKLTQIWFEPKGVKNGEFSPDGKYVLVVQDYGQAKIYDRKSGALFLHPFGQLDGLVGAAYSHDGRYIVTVSENEGSICIWDSSSLQEVHLWSRPTQISNARFSPSGSRLVAACEDGIARVYNVESGKIELSLPHTKGVLFADFSKDGKFIVTCSKDHTARIWDATTGKPFGRPLEHRAWVYYAAFSADGQRLVTASGDHRAKVWDVDTCRQVSPDLIHDDAVFTAEFSPDDRIILTSSLDGKIRLWSADDFEPYKSIAILNQGERVTHAAFDREGRCLLATCANGSVRVWDLAGRLVPIALPRSHFSADGKRFLQTSNDIVTIKDTIGNGGPTLITSSLPVERADFCHGGRFVWTVSPLQTNANAKFHILQEWDAATGSAVANQITCTNFLAGLSLSDDGMRLAVFGNRSVQVWDVLKGKALFQPTIHPTKVNLVFFNPNGQHIAVVASNLVYLLNAVDGSPVCQPLTNAQVVTHAEFSPDGSRLVTCCADALLNKFYAQVWDANSGSPVGPRLAHEDGVLDAVFSPDGRHVVTAGEDFNAIIWETETGKQCAVLRQHEKVAEVAFSPDGTRLVTACTDGVARIWDPQTGDALSPPLQHIKPLESAQFLADDNQLVVADVQGNQFKWNFPIERRPADEIKKLARLLSSEVAARSPMTAPGGAQSIESLWTQLRPENPDVFMVSAREIAAWHEFQAEDCEYQREWLGAAFHLESLLQMRPDDPALTKRLNAAGNSLNKGK